MTEEESAGMTGERVEYRERVDGDCREGEWYGL